MQQERNTEDRNWQKSKETLENKEQQNLESLLSQSFITMRKQCSLQEHNHCPVIHFQIS